jgi:hypothetical protein
VIASAFITLLSQQKTDYLYCKTSGATTLQAY